MAMLFVRAANQFSPLFKEKLHVCVKKMEKLQEVLALLIEN